MKQILNSWAIKNKVIHLERSHKSNIRIWSSVLMVVIVEESKEIELNMARSINISKYQLLGEI